MKALNLMFLFSLLLQPVMAQITGSVIDSGGDAIPFANVLLLNDNDSSLIQGAITDEGGKFVIDKIDNIVGTYFLRYSAVGFQTYNSSTFYLKNLAKAFPFEPQTMLEDTKQLEEVLVQAEKPLYEQKLGSTIVNVESSVLTKGSSALQLLERSPGVFVDRRNNDIILNGKSGVMVMINGKLMRLSVNDVVSMLNGMSADNIEKIELLATPPAKYDAEGSAGMINIVLKRSEDLGTKGSFSLTGGYGWGEKAAASTDISHNEGNLSIHGSYSYLHDRSYSNWFAEGYQDVPVVGENTFGFWSRTEPVQDAHNVSIGTDIKINNTTIGANAAYNYNAISSSIFNRGEYIILPDSFLLMRAGIDGHNRWDNIAATIYGEKTVGERASISIVADYLEYENDNSSRISSSFTDGYENEVVLNGDLASTNQRSLANTVVNIGVLKADYSTQLGKVLKLEAGIKGTYTESFGASSIEGKEGTSWLDRPILSNEANVNEVIGAVYSSVDWQPDSLSNVVIGVRYEYSKTDIRDVTTEGQVEREISKIFPNLIFTRTINDKSSIRFSYSKRISRPAYNDLVSYFTYNDPVSVFAGNSLLRPTIANNIEIGYNYSGYSFSILLSRDNNPIARYQIAEGPAQGVIYITPQNLTYQNNLNIQANFPLKISSWWDMNVGFTGGLRQFEVTHTPNETAKTYFGYNTYGSQVFALPYGFSLEISGFYNSVSYNGSVRIGKFGMLNAGIKKDLRNNLGTIQFSVTDLLKSMSVDAYIGHLTEEVFSLKSQVNSNAESAISRIFKLTYSKSFGNNKVKSRKQRNASSEEERSRIINN